MMKALKDKPPDKSEIDIDIANETWAVNGTYDYVKVNEELYSLLVSKTEGEARSTVMKAGQGQGLEAYRMINH